MVLLGDWNFNPKDAARIDLNALDTSSCAASVRSRIQELCTESVDTAYQELCDVVNLLRAGFTENNPAVFSCVVFLHIGKLKTYQPHLVQSLVHARQDVRRTVNCGMTGD